MVTVYTPDGTAEEKDPVDARECVEHCGYTYEPPVTLDGEEESKSADTSDKASGKGKKSTSAVEQIHDPNS